MQVRENTPMAEICGSTNVKMGVVNGFFALLFMGADERWALVLPGLFR
jgi:hypothetical protein